MSWFTSHGTKAIGTITAVAGVAAGIDPATVPPSWIPWIMALSGLATVARGFQNTANQQPPTIR
jgi:hypothetical protein